ncbi:MAG TPA: hypothetical protein PL126_03360 [Candidatus Cloacimonadota bacterium]|nr:hypothetical protein [Candidatus Cloacimonadota bacterium]
MKALICLLIPILLLCASCDRETPEEIISREIKDILYNISRHYNWGEIDDMMEYASMDYRHNGMQRMHLRQLWLDRMGRYPLMEIREVMVSFDGVYAIAGFKMSLISSEESVVSREPEDHGDLSFFYYDGFEWKLHGNQEFFKK